MLPIVVVGAGAAGLVAAIFAGAAGRPVVLLERTRDGGRKILISGGGRCNILPVAIEPARFVTDSAIHTLRAILRSWPLESQRRFFEDEARVPLELEAETGKYFPRSDSARHVRDALVSLARARGVDIRSEALVVDLEPATATTPWIVRASDDAQVLRARAVVLATGGLSVPSTGSDGIGLQIASRLGHVIHETYPALTPLVAVPHPHASLAGVSVQATLEAPGGRHTTKARGGVLFTHRGYSGPGVLDVSHCAVRALQHGASQPIHVGWGDLEPGEWEARLRGGARPVAAVLRERLPARLAGALMAEANVPPDRRTSELLRRERRDLIARLTRYALPWSGHEGYRKAEVTGGGVALGEVHPATLESRRRPGLFFCGEMLDAFGPIGGHNFAWAWVTGRLAGRGARGAIER